MIITIDGRFVRQLSKLNSKQYRISITERSGPGGVEPTTAAITFSILSFNQSSIRARSNPTRSIRCHYSRFSTM
jgi:hypothetical protein